MDSLYEFVGLCFDCEMGFCWLCSSGFFLVVVVRFVGLAVLDGVTIGLAMGRGSWVSPLI